MFLLTLTLPPAFSIEAKVRREGAPGTRSRYWFSVEKASIGKW
jgi:hypothetical protein